MSQNVCEICNIHCSSAAFLAEHLNGKKHAAAVEEAERLLEISQRSVFLSNFHSRVFFFKFFLFQQKQTF